MTENYIEFKKKREIGDILSDTFKFLRENYKQLFTLIFKIAGPAFLVAIAALAFYFYSFKGLFNPLAGQNSFESLNAGTMVISGLIMIIAIVVYYSLQLGTVLYFIKSYVQNSGAVNDDDVKAGVKARFGSLIGLGFLSGLIMIAGLFFCVIPGIYLYVPMSITYAIMVYANRDVTDSIGDSFKLIKDEWWNTFLALFVLGLVVGMISFVFQIPSFIYSMFKGFTMASEGTITDPMEMYDWVMILLSILPTIVQYILYAISIVGIAFIYFNLNERKNFTGTLEQIDSLGKTE